MRAIWKREREREREKERERERERVREREGGRDIYNLLHFGKQVVPFRQSPI